MDPLKKVVAFIITAAFVFSAVSCSFFGGPVSSGEGDVDVPRYASTPEKYLQKQVDAYMKNSCGFFEYLEVMTNGCYTSQFKAFLRDFFEYFPEYDKNGEFEDYTRSEKQNSVDKFGENFKVELKIRDEEKQDGEVIENVRDKLRYYVDVYQGAIDRYEAMTSNEKKDLASQNDLELSKLDKLIKDLKNLLNEFLKSKISQCCKYDIVIIRSGGADTEPEESVSSVYICTINGKLIMESAIYEFAQLVESAVFGIGF